MHLQQPEQHSLLLVLPELLRQQIHARLQPLQQQLQLLPLPWQLPMSALLQAQQLFQRRVFLRLSTLFRDAQLQSFCL